MVCNITAINEKVNHFDPTIDYVKLYENCSFTNSFNAGPAGPNKDVEITFKFILYILALIEGLLLLYVIYKDPLKRFRNPASYFIANFTTADLLSITGGLFDAILQLLLQTDPSKLNHKIAGCLAAIGLQSSFLTIMIFAFDRYFAIAQPYKYQNVMMGRKLVLTSLLVFPWCFAIITLPITYFSSESNTLTHLFAGNIIILTCITLFVHPLTYWTFKKNVGDVMTQRSRGNANSKANTEIYRNANANRNTDTTADRNANRNANANTNANAISNANSNAITNKNANANINTNRDVNGNTNRNTNTNGNTDGKTNGNTNRNTNTDGNTNRNTNTDGKINGKKNWKTIGNPNKQLADENLRIAKVMSTTVLMVSLSLIIYMSPYLVTFSFRLAKCDECFLSHAYTSLWLYYPLLTAARLMTNSLIYVWRLPLYRKSLRSLLNKKIGHYRNNVSNSQSGKSGFTDENASKDSSRPSNIQDDEKVKNSKPENPTESNNNMEMAISSGKQHGLVSTESGVKNTGMDNFDEQF